MRDRTGHIRHDGGVVTGAPGLYVLGMPVLRTRASTYIHGAAADSEALADHLHSLPQQRTPVIGVRLQMSSARQAAARAAPSVSTGR